MSKGSKTILKTQIIRKKSDYPDHLNTDMIGWFNKEMIAEKQMILNK
jgi:hypothetical protein